jgi:hypothetical protein
MRKERQTRVGNVVKCCVVAWLSIATSALAWQELRAVPLGGLRLSWIQSAIWINSSSMVVVTDPVGRIVSGFKLTGLDSIEARSFAVDVRPSYVARSRSGFLQVVQDRSGIHREIHWLGAGLARSGTTPLRGSTVFYSWIVVADRIFAYGAFADDRDPESGWSFGFFTHKLRSPASRRGLLRVAPVETFQEVGHYITGAPYMVSIGSMVYYVEMGMRPALKVYDVEREGSSSYLSGLAISGAPLPEIDVGAPTSDIFDLIEGLSMPAGIYVDTGGDFLYFLRRQPEGGATRWTMTKLRPWPEVGTVEDLGTVRLPTSAPHLTVLFAPDSVLLFERSSVHPGTRRQDVETMLVVPKLWVTEPGRWSPLVEVAQ